MDRLDWQDNRRINAQLLNHRPGLVAGRSFLAGHYLWQARGWYSQNGRQVFLTQMLSGHSVLKGCGQSRSRYREMLPLIFFNKGGKGIKFQQFRIIRKDWAYSKDILFYAISSLNHQYFTRFRQLIAVIVRKFRLNRYNCTTPKARSVIIQNEVTLDDLFGWKKNAIPSYPIIILPAKMSMSLSGKPKRLATVFQSFNEFLTSAIILEASSLGI